MRIAERKLEKAAQKTLHGLYSSETGHTPKSNAAQLRMRTRFTAANVILGTAAQNAPLSNVLPLQTLLAAEALNLVATAVIGDKLVSGSRIHRQRMFQRIRKCPARNRKCRVPIGKERRQSQNLFVHFSFIFWFVCCCATVLRALHGLISFVKMRASLGSFADPRKKGLRSNVKRLGRILGGIIKQENEAIYEHVETLRGASKAFRRGSPDEANNHFARMAACAHSLKPEDTKNVARSFAHFMNLSNCAETHHRVLETESLRREQGEASPFPNQQDSSRGAIMALLHEEGLDPATVRDTLLQQRVELVLTAHPTEVNRKTVLEKHRRINRLLNESEKLDRLGEDLEHSFDRIEVEDGLRREVASLWASDQIRRFKPTPFAEAQSGLAVVETVLWRAVPKYLRKLNAELVRQLSAAGLPANKAELPFEATPIRFASWIGGDRDGNPFVSAKTTLQVCALHRFTAAKLYINDLDALYDELSMSSGFSEKVVQISRTIKESPDEIELYRRLVGHLRARLVATANFYGERIDVVNTRRAEPLPPGTQPLTDPSELLESLMAIHRSLVASGREEIASGRLTDIIRLCAAFGLTIMPLDVRQESSRHQEAIDAITRFLGLGAFGQWDEDTKINWLCQELGNSRPLLPHQVLDDLQSTGFPETVIETLETFRAAAQLGSGSLGAYVISQAKSASDVLAVALLQQEFGLICPPAAAGEGGITRKTHQGEIGKQMLRVVPLFETLDDLNNAPAIMERLLSLPAYSGRIANRQEIMVGYSDSAKDAGRLAACWAQYRCQEELVKVAKRVGGVELTFFHGKGGSVGRGGNPAVYRAVLSHPPRTIDGRFRVTEQGEMIAQNFGDPDIAQRILDVYTAAVLREKHHTHVVPSEKWRQVMDAVSESSCAHYRKMVREEPDFVKYFRTVTPELELGALNVGSRPAKRNPDGGIESLRAIPWIFAWSQTRCHLPAWLGVNAGLSQKEQNETLQEMYKMWPWFREIVDLVSMILLKADVPICRNYDAQLIPASEFDESTKMQMQKLGESIRRELGETIEEILRISHQEDLTMGNQILQREMEVRTPYLDSLNMIQCEVLRRLRNKEFASQDEEAILRDALLITINGIAAGLKNSG